MQYAYGGWVNTTSPMKRLLIPSNQPGIKVQAAAITATGNQADSIQAEGANGVYVTVIVTAVSGTSPTLTVSLQDSANGTSGWTSEASSASITAAGTYTFFAQLQNGFFRASWVAGGTTPSFTTQIYLTPFYVGPNA